MTQRIAKLVTDGFYKEAISLYSELHSASFLPNKFNFPFLLKACSKIRAFPLVQMIHVQIIKAGFQFKIHTATALTDAYMKFNLINDATKVFDEIPNPTIFSFNSVVSGLSQNGFFKEGLKMFLQLVGIQITRPDSVTIAGLSSGCDDLNEGMQLHSWAIKIGVETDIYAGTSLLTMYFNSGDVISAQRLYECIQFKNVVCYNAYMSGLLQNGIHCQVLYVFNEMRRLSKGKPNLVTLISVASACTSIKGLQLGRQLHGYTVKDVLGFETKVGTSLINMYSKCGSWESAYQVFLELRSVRNMVTWNTMIAGLIMNNESEIAIDLFVQLINEGLKPDLVTWNSIICGFSQQGKDAEAFTFFKKMLSAGVIPTPISMMGLLRACSALSKLSCGKEIHAYVLRKGMSTDEFIVTALIDMYMKCGKSLSANTVFNLFSEKPNDPVIFNAMISGYGRNGEKEAAFQIFHQMLKSKIRPNSVTFSCMLLVCSHTGQVDHLWQVFRSMTVDYGLKPTPEQLNIIVDLIGRTGQLKEAEGFMEEITDPSASVLCSLLGAAKQYADYEFGQELVKKLSALDPNDPTPFVILSNICAELGKWNDVEKIRNMMQERKLRKLPGYSISGAT